MNSENQIENDHSHIEIQEVKEEVKVEDSCGICYDSSKEVPVIHEGCRIRCCAGCILLYSINCCQYNPYLIKLNDSIPCPGGCSRTIPLPEILLILPREEKEALSEALMKFYANHSVDMLTCPNAACKYAGYLVAEHSGCERPFQCNVCEIEFVHPIIQQRSSSRFKDFLSQIVKAFTSKRCPHCRAPITKIAGCSSMICGNCRGHFNWILVSYPGWRIVSIIIFIIAVVLCAIYRKEIWNFLGQHIIEEVFIGIASFWMLMLHVQYIGLIAMFCSRGINIFNIALILIPCLIEYLLYHFFPVTMKTLFTYMIYEASLFTLFWIIVSAIVLAGDYMVRRRARIRRPEQVALVAELQPHNQEELEPL